MKFIPTINKKLTFFVKPNISSGNNQMDQVSSCLSSCYSFDINSCLRFSILFMHHFPLYTSYISQSPRLLASIFYSSYNAWEDLFVLPSVPTILSALVISCTIFPKNMNHALLPSFFLLSGGTLQKYARSKKKAASTSRHGVTFVYYLRCSCPPTCLSSLDLSHCLDRSDIYCFDSSDIFLPDSYRPSSGMT